MKYIHEILRERLLIQAGLVDLPKPKYTYEQLQQKEWSPKFEELIRNRLIMGALRYGSINDSPKKGKRRPIAKRIKSDIDDYELTGNTEKLVDIATYCFVQFVRDPHPTKHFAAIDEHLNHA